MCEMFWHGKYMKLTLFVIQISPQTIEISSDNQDD